MSQREKRSKINAGYWLFNIREKKKDLFCLIMSFNNLGHSFLLSMQGFKVEDF